MIYLKFRPYILEDVCRVSNTLKNKGTTNVLVYNASYPVNSYFWINIFACDGNL